MISFCIPARNEEKNLPHTIKSIQKACLKAKELYEIVVCNNNSQDKTEEVAKKLGARVVNLAEPNISKSRNTAAKAAKGDILIFVDADTVLKDTVVEEAIKALNSKRFYAVTQIVRHKKYPTLASYGVWLFNIITLLTGIGSGQFIAIKKEHYKKIGMFDEKIFAYEDMLFYKKVIKNFGVRSVKVITKTGYTSHRKYEQGHNLKKFLLGIIGIMLNFRIARNKENLEYWYGKPIKDTPKFKINKILFIIIFILLIVDSYFPYIQYLQNPMVRNTSLITVFVLGTFIVISKPSELLLLPVLYLIEYIGVEIGLPFGKYSFNPELTQLLGVPLFIPFAWFVLIKGTYLGIRNLFGTALFIVIFDVILEMFVAKNGYWTWENANLYNSNLLPAPFINYLTWFGIAIVLVSFIKFLTKNVKRPDRFRSSLVIVVIMHYVTSNLSATPGGLIGLLIVIAFICISVVNSIREI